MRRVGTILLLILWPCAALAWGPATHMYIAECVAGSQDTTLLFASTVPDMNAVLINVPASKSCVQHLLHNHPEMLPPSFFAIGMATHNSDWGADYYAHLFFHPENPECDTTYSTIKIRQFSTELGISLSQAEDLFEMTIDYLLRMARGPELGHRIKVCTESFGPAQEQLLVDTYAEALAACVTGYTVEQAESDIRTAATAFRIITGIFGEQLMLDDTQITAAIPALLARYMSVDKATATTYFQYAVAACQDDYQAELDRVCALVRAHMDALPEYRMPAGRPCLFAVLALLLGLVSLRKLRILGRTGLH